MTDRDWKLLQFTFMTLAVDRAVSNPFWRAFDSDIERVTAVQGKMGEELRILAHELWPETRR